MRFGVVALRALVAIVVLGSLPAEAAIKVKSETIAQKAKGFEIEIAWPRTGIKRIDDVLLRFAKEKQADYTAMARERDDSERPYAFELKYNVARNDAKAFAVLFDEYTDTGGAHPNSYSYAFNFLMPDGGLVYLPEILDGTRGLQRVSQYAVASLHKQLDGPDSMSDADWLNRGAGPLATNFAVFILQPDRIDLTFPAYQVAAYAAGPQEVHMPLSWLKGYIRKDWSTPLPSFDCGKAKTFIEQAICADASLARMDRQVAEIYAAHLANSYDKAERDKWRKDQRQWLVTRDKTCFVSAPIGCLRKTYSERLALLKKRTAGQ